MLRIAGTAAEEFFKCPEDLWASLRDLGEIASLLDRMGMSEEREARIVEGKARARIRCDRASRRTVCLIRRPWLGRFRITGRVHRDLARHRFLAPRKPSLMCYARQYWPLSIPTGPFVF
jgi:hypothetical protein